MNEWTYPGHAADLAARSWTVDRPRYVAVLCHGYGEHIGRYEWVARVLNEHGAGVYGVDHVGHGRSAGERVPIDPSTLSRDPAVGQTYAADPLVWHGDFKRPTLQALKDAMDRIAAGGSVGELPVLHVHGEDDQLVPLEPSQAGVEAVRGPRTEAKTYPGARHEIFNETNRDEVLADVTGFIDRVLER